MTQKTVTLIPDLTKIDLSKSFLEVYDNTALAFTAYNTDVSLSFNNVKYTMQLRLNVLD